MIDLKVQLDWKPNAQFAGLIWAIEQKWYEKAGLNVNLIPWRPFLNQMDVLAADPTTLVSTEDNLLIKAIAQGADACAFSTMMQYSGLGWMTRKEENITRLEQLRGKRIGIHTDGRTGLLIALQTAGVSPEECSIEDMDYDYEQHLMSGYVAAMQCMCAVEPVELEAKNRPINVILAKDYGYYVYSQVMAGNRSYLLAEKDAIADFTRITYDGWRAAFADPQQAAKYIVEKYTQDSSLEIEAASIQKMYPLFPYHGDDRMMGYMEKSRWDKSISILQAEGYSTSNLTADAVMTDAIQTMLY